MAPLPTGTVTFLFTDIESSTRMWQDYPGKMKEALVRHDEILRSAIEANGGYVFKTVGDSFCAAFDTALEGLNGALQAQLTLHKETWDSDTPIRVRMGLHTGEAVERDRDYYGPAVNRTSRLESIGYGGQTLVSLVTAELVRDMMPEDVSLKEMGARRLKDLTRPESVYQLMHPDLPSEFPALKSLDRHVHNIPVQPTPLIGREEEIGIVESMLSAQADPIVTLTGPGGMGKTRLALQVGAELIEQFEHGVFFVDLSFISDPELMPATIAQVLSLREAGNRPFMTVLKEYLKDRETLLILDNFEQIMPSRDHVVELTRACGNLKIVVTSREPLHIRGERVFAVPALSIPDDKTLASKDREAISQYESVQLFIERSIAAKQDFSITNENAPAVAEICVRLDGIPLAIELAAARIKILSPDAILERLQQRFRLLKGGINDLPERQQTLRATIDWSYNMLEEECKSLFCQLSVFSRGFSLDAAEAVCEIASEEDLLMRIESLVDKSFVYTKGSENDEPRFYLLETMRVYGAEKLRESGNLENIRFLHAKYFHSRVLELCPRLKGRELKNCLDKLDREYGNIREALGWYHAQKKIKPVLEICDNIWRFWQTRGHLTEGRRQTEKALILGKDGSDVLVAGVLLGAGNLSKEQGDYNQALKYITSCYSVLKRSNAKSLVADALHELGWLYYRMNNIQEAKKAFEIARQNAEKKSDVHLTAMCGIGLGAVHWRMSETDIAEKYLEQSRSTAIKTGDSRIMALALCNLGIIEREKNNLQKAKELYELTLEKLEQVDDQATLRGTYNNLGDIHFLLANYETSIEYYAKLLQLSWAVGDRRLVSTAYAGMAESYLAMDNLEEALKYAQLAYNSVQELRGGIELGTSLRILGQIHMHTKRLTEAEELLSKSVSILESVHFDEEFLKAKESLQNVREVL